MVSGIAFEPWGLVSMGTGAMGFRELMRRVYSLGGSPVSAVFNITIETIWSS